MRDAHLVGRRAEKNRKYFSLANSVSQRLLDLIGRQILAVEKFFQEIIVGLGNVLDELLAHLFGPCLQIVRYRPLGELSRISFVDVGFHREQIDDTFESGFNPDGELKISRFSFQSLEHGRDALLHFRLLMVHLVDEQQPAHLIFVGVRP